MPISLRYFYLKMLIDQKEKESDQLKTSSAPNSNVVARPPIVKK